MSKVKSEAKLTQAEVALVEPMLLAFNQGNYLKTRRLANALLQDTESTPSVLNVAKKMMIRTGNDPYVLWIGIATVVFATIVALFTLN